MGSDVMQTWRYINPVGSTPRFVRAPVRLGEGHGVFNLPGKIAQLQSESLRENAKKIELLEGKGLAIWIFVKMKPHKVAGYAE